MLTIRLQEAREDERLRISRELHDELGQKMSALKMDLRWIEKHLHGFATPEGIRATRQRVLESLTLTDDAIERVQRIAFELRPSALDHLGLAGAMREEARRFEARTGIRMKLVLPDSLTVSDAGLATMFFRIFQELLTNVARHAKAEEVTATFKQVDGELVMDLSDDGIGLPPGALGANRSLGLLGIQERAAAHEGSVIFDSVAGEGTSVSVRVPAVGSKAGAP
jgi:signal transduction histidine kinase